MSTLRAGLIGAHISATRLPAALQMLCAEAGWSLEFQLIDTADRDFDFNAEVSACHDAGGVAEANVPAIKTLGTSEIFVTALDMAKAQNLATRSGATAVPEAFRDVMGLVNATPVGMAYAPGLPVAQGLIGPQDRAFDAVYTPTDTAIPKTSNSSGTWP
ncbi:MAG: hypothetical protein AAGH70_01645 [Pseudomonadota bacterium]